MNNTANEVMRKMINIIEEALIVFNQQSELTESQEETDALQAVISSYGLND